MRAVTAMLQLLLKDSDNLREHKGEWRNLVESSEAAMNTTRGIENAPGL